MNGRYIRISRDRFAPVCDRERNEPTSTRLPRGEVGRKGLADRHILWALTG